MQRSSQRGQVIVLFALALSAVVLGVAVVVDGGYAFSQRRASQNAADFAAMAGTRIVGSALTGQPPGAGTALNVENAVKSVLAANDADLIAAQYVDDTGKALGNVVGASKIPSTAFGVVVDARKGWQPFLLGVIGVINWEASSTATAMTDGRSLGGGVLPIGIRDVTYDSLEPCPVTDLFTCVDQNLTSGSLNIPGGFGWLKFGLQGNGGKCNWSSSLGMIADGGCQSSKPFLDSQIGPPNDAHGCCTAIDLPGSEDKIGSLTGNEWGDIRYYTTNRIPIWVPIWDTADGNGANGYYNIVGFGAIVLTGENQHAKWLEGAAISGACLPGTEIPDSQFCTTPGDTFIIDATGTVQLVR